MGDMTGSTDLLAAAQDLQARIVLQRDAVETSRRLPVDLVHELTRGGFFRIFLPAAYGGLDLAPADGIERRKPSFGLFMAGAIVGGTGEIRAPPTARPS